MSENSGKLKTLQGRTHFQEYLGKTNCSRWREIGRLREKWRTRGGWGRIEQKESE